MKLFLFTIKSMDKRISLTVFAASLLTDSANQSLLQNDLSRLGLLVFLKF